MMKQVHPWHHAVASDPLWQPLGMAPGLAMRTSTGPLEPMPSSPDPMGVASPPMGSWAISWAHTSPVGAARDEQLAGPAEASLSDASSSSSSSYWTETASDVFHDEALSSPVGSMALEAGSKHAMTQNKRNGLVSPKLSPEEKKKQSILMRRKRNRESMRRSRQREKETLAVLRATLTQLEQHYEQLTRTDHLVTDASQIARCKRWQSKLAALIQCRRQLEAETQVNVVKLQAQETLLQDLQGILTSFHLEDKQTLLEKLSLLEYRSPGAKGAARINRINLPLPSTVLPRSEVVSICEATGELQFSSLLPNEVGGIIAQFCQELQYVREATHSVQDPPPLEVLGWTTRRRVDRDNQMHFEFKKCFAHHSAESLTQRSWQHGTDLEAYKLKEKSFTFRRLEFVQRVDADTGVIVREILHPTDPVVFRTLYVIFRVPTLEGYAFGLKSMNPVDPPECSVEHEGQNMDVVWIDVAFLLEFVRLWGASEPACEVRWRGKTNYKSPKHAADNALQFLMGLLRWENMIIGPRFHLSTS